MTNPRDRRIQSDYEKVVRLVSESGGTLRLLRASGTPPTSYAVEYNCPSLVKDAVGDPVVQNRHQVEINLSVDYPLKPPTARMLTPVFNPHVFSSNAICLGVVWSAADTLDSLIIRIGALLQLDPRVLDARSPANAEANQWVQANRAKLPLGKVTFKAGTESTRRIQWS